MDDIVALNYPADKLLLNASCSLLVSFGLELCFEIFKLCSADLE